MVDLPPTNEVRRDEEGFLLPPVQAKKARRQERGDRLGKRRKREYTTGTRTATKLTSAPIRYELFLFRLNKEATDDKIRDFVDDETMNVVEIECMSQEHYYTKSYRIVLQGNDLDRVHEPEIWPEGVCCRRFRKTREQDGE